jgi:hypothetical protein
MYRVRSSGRSDAQQLAWPGVAAAQVAMQGSEGKRLADAVPQPHEVGRCPRRFVYADGLAGSCFHVSQPEHRDLDGCGKLIG